MERGRMKLPELKKLVRVAKRAGVKRLVMPGVHLEFHESAEPVSKKAAQDTLWTGFSAKTGEVDKFFQPKPVAVPTELPELGEEMPNDEEMVLYSTPFFGLESEQEEESEETEVTKESEAS